MNRRSFLGTSCAATLGGLAGCAGLLSGDDGSTGGTTAGPSFAAVTIHPPGDPVVGDEFEVAVEVTNDGGASGGFDGTVELTGPRRLTRSVTVGEVAPGETGTTTVSVAVDYAGTYTARLPEADANAEFVVRPRETEFEEAETLRDDVEFAVEDARIEPTLVAEGRGPLHLDGLASRRGGVPHVLPATDPGEAPADHPAAALPGDAEVVLLVVEATVTNGGDRPYTVDPSALDLRTDVGDAPRFFADVGREIDEGITIADAGAAIGTPPLAGAEVEAGEETRGWLLAPLARETAEEGGIDVGVNRRPPDPGEGKGEEGTPDPGDDAVAGGPPETLWRVVPDTGADLPRFELRSLTVPDEVPNLTTAEFWVTVENVGDAPGTYRDVLEMTGNHEWDPVGTVTGEVPAGERMGLSGEFFVAYAEKQGLTLQRGTTGDVVELPSHGVEGAEATCVGSWLELPFPYEETLELTNGTRLTFETIEYISSFDLTSTTGVSGPFLMVRVLAELPRRAVGREVGHQMIPRLEDFGYKYHPDWEAREPNPHGYGPVYPSNRMIRPIEGLLYQPVPPSEPADGRYLAWIAFQNPDRDAEYNQNFDYLAQEERVIQLTTTVKYSARGWGKNVAIRWSPKFD